jgi:hypothetical protein
MNTNEVTDHGPNARSSPPQFLSFRRVSKVAAAALSAAFLGATTVVVGGGLGLASASGAGPALYASNNPVSANLGTLIGSSYTVLRTLTLPAGTYYISARVTLRNESTAAPALIRCQTTAAGTEVNIGVASLSAGGQGAYDITYPEEEAVTLAASGVVDFECQYFTVDSYTSATITAFPQQMLAVQVGSITYQ